MKLTRLQLEIISKYINSQEYMILKSLEYKIYNKDNFETRQNYSDYIKFLRNKYTDLGEIIDFFILNSRL